MLLALLQWVAPVLVRPPTVEVYARIWNGGPEGWRKSSTLAYWRRVRNALAARLRLRDLGYMD